MYLYEHQYHYLANARRQMDGDKDDKGTQRPNKGGQPPMGRKLRERKGDKQDRPRQTHPTIQTVPDLFNYPSQPKPEHGLQSMPGRSFIGIC